MAAKKLPSQTELNRLLRYDPATGLLYWRNHPARNIKAGTEAFQNKTNKGYKRGGLIGRNAMAHRVIWKMVYGTEPEEIDHINGQCDDNRLANLRAADRTLNNRNARRRASNKSGRIGVYQNKGKWVANIGVNGRCLHLGYYDKKETAIAVREEAERRYGYPPSARRLERDPAAQ